MVLICIFIFTFFLVIFLFFSFLLVKRVTSQYMIPLINSLPSCPKGYSLHAFCNHMSVVWVLLWQLWMPVSFSFIWCQTSMTLAWFMWILDFIASVPEYLVWSINLSFSLPSQKGLEDQWFPAGSGDRMPSSFWHRSQGVLCSFIISGRFTLRMC